MQALDFFLRGCMRLASGRSICIDARSRKVPTTTQIKSCALSLRLIRCAFQTQVMQIQKICHHRSARWLQMVQHLEQISFIIASNMLFWHIIFPKDATSKLVHNPV